MNEPKCPSRIPVFYEVLSSYAEKVQIDRNDTKFITCQSLDPDNFLYSIRVNTRKHSVGRTHVRRLFWLPMRCMTSSSLFASFVYNPYSIQTDSKPSVNTQIP